MEIQTQLGWCWRYPECLSRILVHASPTSTCQFLYLLAYYSLFYPTACDRQIKDAKNYVQAPSQTLSTKDQQEYVYKFSSFLISL